MSGANRTNRNIGSVISSLTEFNNTVCKRKQSKVSSNANIFAGMVFSATLAHDNVAGYNRLTTEDLYAKPFALRIPTVLYTTFTFFMCHGLQFES